jgi:hypothetical protein
MALRENAIQICVCRANQNAGKAVGGRRLEAASPYYAGQESQPPAEVALWVRWVRRRRHGRSEFELRLVEGDLLLTCCHKFYQVAMFSLPILIFPSLWKRTLTLDVINCRSVWTTNNKEIIP